MEDVMNSTGSVRAVTQRVAHLKSHLIHPPSSPQDSKPQNTRIEFVLEKIKAYFKTEQIDCLIDFKELEQQVNNFPDILNFLFEALQKHTPNTLIPLILKDLLHITSTKGQTPTDSKQPPTDWMTISCILKSLPESTDTDTLSKIIKDAHVAVAYIINTKAKLPLDLTRLKSLNNQVLFKFIQSNTPSEASARQTSEIWASAPVIICKMCKKLCAAPYSMDDIISQLKNVSNQPPLKQIQALSFLSKL
jgi:hypothetical protein